MIVNHTTFPRRKSVINKIFTIVYKKQKVELMKEGCEICCKYRTLSVPHFDEKRRFHTDFSFQTYKEAIDTSNFENVKKLLEHNYCVAGKEDITDINPFKTKKMSALMYAVEKMEKDIVLEIIKRRPDIVQQHDELGNNMWDYLVRKFREEDHRVIYKGNKKCSICLEKLCGKKSVISLASCRHLFHEHCFESWEARSDACPLCRYSVDSRLSSIEREKIDLVKHIHKALRYHKKRFFPEERMYQAAFENHFNDLGEFLDYHDY